MNSKELISAIGLANMSMKILGHSALTGLNSALDTFASQAAGAKNHILCGVFLNRARFILITAFMPVTFFFCNV